MQLLTIDEVATRLRMHPRSVRRLLRAGELASIKPSPRRTLIRATELESALVRWGTAGEENQHGEPR